MLSIIKKSYDDLRSGLDQADAQSEGLIKAAKTISSCLTGGGTVYLCGNGGSAAEAQHFAAELVGRFLIERPGLAAISLTTDTSILTAIGNDYGYQSLFSRQIKALGRPGDVLWALSTSGTSPNVLAALALAKECAIKTIFMCGTTLPLQQTADIVISGIAATTPRIQELHLLYGHIICQLVEQIIFQGLED
jgi:D-sedoheptulose 7-phosphate isomerase